MRSLLFVTFTITANVVFALTESSIEMCPILEPRSTPPTSVDDLRADDIKVIGALGDSIMTGFGIDGLGNANSLVLNITAMKESRGNSWAIGGDSDAITIATMLRHYNSNLKGPSMGNRMPTYCLGDLCMTFRFPTEDVLNSALSGAIAMNLDDELDYLIPELKNISGADFQNDWKFITIQIGNNDQCRSCLVNRAPEVTIEKYGYYVDKAVARIKNEIPHTIVNLVGNLKVSHIYNLTKGEDVCNPVFHQPNWILNRFECPCFLRSEEKILAMDTLANGFNAQLQSIARKYNAEQNSTFAVVYQPADINIDSLPIDAFSDVDCFHPSKATHQWLAKIIWNNLFIEPDEKITTFDYDANQQVYCPSETDRIRF